MNAPEDEVTPDVQFTSEVRQEMITSGGVTPAAPVVGDFEHGDEVTHALRAMAEQDDQHQIAGSPPQ